MTRIKTKTSTTCGNVFPGQVIRSRRQQMGWKASDFARRANINPRTLNAIEMGRIELPSLKHLRSISKALGVSIASFFSEQFGDSERTFLLGDQKGQQALEFPKDGFRIVCYTPLVRHFFMGKAILRGNAKIDGKRIGMSGMVFVQPIIGKLLVHFDGTDHIIREGNYVFFDGCFPHSYANPLHRECSFLLATSPSFQASGTKS